tara:strand:+ start:79 stop:438 length:360 start_codon:yes stop_codon:yes gene_type:complete
VYFDTGKPPVAYVFENLPSEGPVLMRKAEADRRIELSDLSYADIEKEFGALGFQKVLPAGWNSKKVPEFFNAQTNQGVNWDAEDKWPETPEIQKNSVTGVTWDFRKVSRKVVSPRADDL